MQAQDFDNRFCCGMLYLHLLNMYKRDFINVFYGKQIKRTNVVFYGVYTGLENEELFV